MRLFGLFRAGFRAGFRAEFRAGFRARCPCWIPCLFPCLFPCTFPCTLSMHVFRSSMVQQRRCKHLLCRTHPLVEVPGIQYPLFYTLKIGKNRTLQLNILLNFYFLQRCLNFPRNRPRFHIRVLAKN